MLLRHFCIITTAVLLTTGCVRQPPVTSHSRQKNEAIEDYLARYLTETDFVGVALITEGGKTLHRQGYGFADRASASPSTPTTRFSLQSLGKQFTLAAVIREQDRGVLDSEDSLARYIPDYPHGEDIRLSDLMFHKSGIVDIYNDLPFEPSDFREPIALNDLVAKFKHLPLEFPPGSRREYSNSGYILLAHVVEKTSGQSFHSYLETNVLGPAGMLDSIAGCDSVVPDLARGYDTRDDYDDDVPYPKTHSSHIVGAGSVYSTAEDLLRWSEASTSLDAWHACAHGAGYGRGLGFTSAFVPLPPLGIVIILLSNCGDTPVQDMAQHIEQTLLADRVIELDAKVLDEFVGEYRSITFESLVSSHTIRREPGGLVVRAIRPGRDVTECELHPISPNQFLLRAEGNYLGVVATFNRDDQGRVDGMTGDDHGLRIESVRTG